MFGEYQKIFLFSNHTQFKMLVTALSNFITNFQKNLIINYSMKTVRILHVTILALLLSTPLFALQVNHKDEEGKEKSKVDKPITSTSNSSECSKEFCISKYALMDDPFNPHCDQNATCWQIWYGFPECKESDLKCWKTSVGYPVNCEDDDYDCWIKFYGFSSCNDAKCLKEFLNYSCKYDDLKCLREKTWAPSCQWNDWQCWVKQSIMGWVCDDKKGFQCVSQFYGKPCKQEDEKCWRQTLYLPDAECQKDVQCFKKFYALPTCKDDDFDCWKGYYFGPDCKKGDMQCLKKFLFIPECKTQKNEVDCYKKWLNYPDCKSDDGKCWKDFDQNHSQMNSLFFRMDFNHKRNQGSKNSHSLSFGKVMEHRRKQMSEKHLYYRQYHTEKTESKAHMKFYN